ncbi:MAG TPA: hypothetical protein VLW84_14700 [Terriglobales bacterium]|nr:hypothetical protein [Terriglobales bacterium]
METFQWGVFLLAVLTMSHTISAQDTEAKKQTTPTSTAASLQVAPDLAGRVAKFRRVEMPYNSSAFTARENKMVEKLVDACRYLEDIFWRQTDPEGLALYKSLEGKKTPQDDLLRQYLWINASRFDLIDEHKPFVGSAPMPLGGGFYPEGVTRAEIEHYVKDHPDQKAAIYSNTTVVRRRGSRMEAIPYRVEYRAFLQPAAKDLREAADFSDDPAFAKFLRLRADALLTDDYYQSDLAWLDLKDPKFDVIFAPYETYDDHLLGVKASYGASILIRNDEQSDKVAIFKKYVADIQDALPLAPEDRPSKHGLETPMEVADAPFRAGDLRHGYQAVADNLPNDPRVHELKGSKKIFFKNFMDARVNYVVLPLAGYMLLPEQAKHVSGEGYLLFTVMHEMAHGLGPAFARTPSGKMDIREAIGPAFSGLEEAKADVVGMFGLNWLVDHGALPKQNLEEYYSSYIAGIFRTVRFGIGEAHGQAEMMEFNYLSERGAITRDSSGRYVMDYARIPAVFNDLAKILLEIEASGDRQRAEAWMTKYDVIPPQLQESLKKAASVPVDVVPEFAFKDDLK